MILADKNEEVSNREWLNGLETSVGGADAKIEKYSVENLPDT